MRMRRLVLSGMVALALSCLSAVAAAEYTINANAPQTGNNFHSLEELRLAMVANTVALGSGDVVVLYNDDGSLTASGMNDVAFLTIRSAGGNKYTVSSGSPLSEMLNLRGASPRLQIDGLHVIGSYTAVNVINDPAMSASGTVDVRNSILESVNGTGAAMYDVASGTFLNTQIIGTATSLLYDNSASGDSGTLDVIFDRNADTYNYWNGNIRVSGNIGINADVAAGKYFNVGGISATGSTIEKTGGGTLKIGGGVNGVDLLDIREGTVQFAPNTRWNGGDIHVGSQGVFKPSIVVTGWDEYIRDPEAGFGGDSPLFNLAGNSIVVDPGARLEIGNISTIRKFDDVKRLSGSILSDLYYPYMIAADINSSNAEELSINNILMKAQFVEINEDNREDLNQMFDFESGQELPDGYTGYYLHISDVNNLSVLEGVGSYADAYRLNPNLSELERDMLDSIYARGGTNGMDRGFLQTIGGAIVQNSLLALRHNQANAVANINRRLTSYHKEELESTPVEVGSSGLCEYREEDPETAYGEMWAFIDQSWMSQNDTDTLAGYRMSTTTLGIGYDHHEDQWIYGGLLTYAGGDMNLKSQSATRNDMDTITAAAYASWAQDGWYISGTGMASYGWNNARSSYTLPGITLEGRTGTFATTGVGLNAEVGYMLETEYCGVPLRVTPYGSLTYARLSRDGIEDTGAVGGGVNLQKRFAAANWNVWDAALGVRLSAPLEMYGKTVVPSLDVSWTRVNGERTPEGGVVHMYNNPAAAWDLDIMSSNRSSLRLVGGIDAKIRENVSLGASYEFEWRKDYWNNRLNINMSMEF